MSTGDTFDFVAGDTASKLIITCKDQDDAAIDLTNYTVVLVWRSDDKVVFSEEMTDNTPASGIMEYTFGDGELRAGTMYLEVKLLDSDGKAVSSCEEIYYTVRPRIEKL